MRHSKDVIRWPVIRLYCDNPEFVRRKKQAFLGGESLAAFMLFEPA